jgi:hypothetical protein
VHWLIAAPIGLLVLASLMFVQNRARPPARALTPAAGAATTAAAPADAGAPVHRNDGYADALQFQRGLAELQRKRPKPALAIFEGLRSEQLRLLGRVMAQHDMRHASESQLALLQLVRDHGHDAAYRIAQAYAWRGQPDEAFFWLDRAVVQRDGGLADVKYDPTLRALRKDARYRALLARLGQPD